MKALERLQLLRRAARCSALALAVLLSVWSSSARADLIRGEDDLTAADAAETFDADCLGETQAEDCDTRAAMLEGEIVMLLSQLEDDYDPATQALFESALALESPVVKSMAVSYLNRTETQPTDFLTNVKTFFFGPDAPLGVTSSAALEGLAEPSDQELASLYQEQRDPSDYAPQEVTGDENQANNRLLQASIKDLRLSMMLSFSEEERFAPAERLLMYDRFMIAAFDPTQSYPVTTFVTDASLDEVSAFFSELFGEPLPPPADNEARIEELTLRIQELQTRAAMGDQDAIKEFIALSEEIQQLQQGTLLQAYLQLPALHAENDLIWLDGKLEDFAMTPTRAVMAGEDPLLGRTVIRYVNAPPATGAGGSDGSGLGGAGEPPGEDGSPAGEGGTGEGVSKRRDDGCGCSVPGAPTGSAGLLAISLLAVMLRRRRR
ncbi:MAG TPA: MYXO-CTERM sorting domain-containing protein [Polyangiaceae bacterium]|nr:MYXO-CTERM sorting domain-containing protein [Polyangiaceae bacterium]